MVNFENSNIDLINFVDLKDEEKKMILEWRNNKDIRKWMYTQHEILQREHYDFLENLKKTKDKLYFLAKLDNTYIGIVNFVKIIKNRSLHMGIYASPNIKGAGKILMQVIIDFSFDVLKVEKIISEVFVENIKAKELYENFAFEQFDEKIINEKRITCMQLLLTNRIKTQKTL